MELIAYPLSAADRNHYSRIYGFIDVNLLFVRSSSGYVRDAIRWVFISSLVFVVARHHYQQPSGPQSEYAPINLLFLALDVLLLWAIDSNAMTPTIG